MGHEGAQGRRPTSLEKEGYTISGWAGRALFRHYLQDRTRMAPENMSVGSRDPLRAAAHQAFLAQ